MTTKKKRITIGKLLQMPGAFVALLIYSLLAFLGIAKGDRDKPIKEFFLRAIPGAAIVIWVIFGVWLFMRLN